LPSRRRSCAWTPPLPRHVLGLSPRFHLFQRCDNLRFRVPPFGHAPPPLKTTKSYSVLCELRGEGQGGPCYLRSVDHRKGHSSTTSSTAKVSPSNFR
jgi:hypothetical protein